MATDNKPFNPQVVAAVGVTPLQYSASIAEIEKQIWDLEGVRVVFRATSTRRIPGPGYDYANRIKNGNFGDLNTRIAKLIKHAGGDIEWAVCDGNGRNKFPDSWSLNKIRKTYEELVAA